MDQSYDGDYIRIYDLTDDGKSIVIASLSNNHIYYYSLGYFQWWRKKKIIISSTSNKMLVEFRSDISLENGGFSAFIHYSTLPSNQCENGLDMTMKSIQSPNYPDSYGNNLACKWLISVPYKIYITLKFLHFDVSFFVISISDSFSKYIHRFFFYSLKIQMIFLIFIMEVVMIQKW